MTEQTEHLIDASIFNTQKTDYELPSLFLGQEMGLLDSINRNFPDIFEKYKKLKEMDWDENDHPFDSCNTEFKTCSKSDYQIAIRSLSWQWEADSIAARSLVAVTAPFISSSDLFFAYGRIADNEGLHALTYSEIVKSSFDDPRLVLAEILAVNEAMKRAETVSRIFHQAYVMSHRLALGEVDRNAQSTYNAIFLFVVAMWCMEKVQFMSSFATTFGLAESGMFVPIGDAVQKICMDESVIHQAVQRQVLTHELKTPRGMRAFQENKEIIRRLIDEVVHTEFTWNASLFQDGRQLAGQNEQMLNQHTLYHAGPIYEFFGFVADHVIPTQAPLSYIDKWFGINSVKAAPQEQRKGNYLLGGTVKDDDRTPIDLAALLA